MSLLLYILPPKFNEFSKRWLLEEYSQKVEERNVQQAIRLFEQVSALVGKKQLSNFS